MRVKCNIVDCQEPLMWFEEFGLWLCINPRCSDGKKTLARLRTRNLIVVYIKGGVLQDVQNLPVNMDYVLIDYDNIEGGES